MSDFTDRLDLLLTSKDIRRATLCRDTGIKESTVRQWYKGSVPSIDVVSKVAKYFNTTTDYLINGDFERIVAETQVTFVKDEAELLNNFRKLNKSNQMAIINLSKDLL